jgi:transposase InsO family protein
VQSVLALSIQIDLAMKTGLSFHRVRPEGRLPGVCQDQAPAEVYATLLDQGWYLCSIRTMYRILDEQQEVRERRNQLRHPDYPKPQLVATAPNQVWSWDITKLLGPAKWTYFYLYPILDIFSRDHRDQSFASVPGGARSAGCWPIAKATTWPSA